MTREYFETPTAATAPPRRRRAPVRGIIVALVVLVMGLGIAFGTGALTSTSVSGGGASAVPGPGSPPSGAPRVADASTIAARVDPGVVDINTNLGYQNARAAGTGIVLTASGLVLTNNHVIAGATTIAVTDVGNGRRYGANVVGYDRANDVALLQLTGAAGLHTLAMGDSSATRVGDSVVAIGNAGGVGGTPSVAQGTLAAIEQTITASDAVGGSSTRLTGLLETSTNIQPGDSGGPLVNSDGQVIGIDAAASAGPTVQAADSTQGYAIPINQALTIARQIATGHASSTIHIGPSAMLGLASIPAVGLDGQPVAGTAVVGVIPGGPADQAGLAAGAVILSVDGHPTSSPSALGDLIDQHRPGDSVRVTWVDAGGRTHDTTVRLVAGPPA